MSSFKKTVAVVDSQGNTEIVEAPGTHQTRERLAELAWLLDSSIRIPGTRFTIGVEALVGLFPFFGDLIGLLFSSYILSEAARIGAPKVVLARMAFNIGVEGVVGIIPFAGDVFDAVFKANQRNVKLLDDWLRDSNRAERSGRAFGLAVALGMLLFLLFLTGVAVLLAGWIWSWF